MAGGRVWATNLYYRQQHSLHKFRERNNHISRGVTYPNGVIGYANGSPMNLASWLVHPSTSEGRLADVLGQCCSICRLQKNLGHDLELPGNEVFFYNKFDCYTSSKLHAEFCKWAALEPKWAIRRSTSTTAISRPGRTCGRDLPEGLA